MINSLIQFLENSYTAYHAVENAKAFLLDNGFVPLLETDDWTIEENGKYFVERNGSALIAFTVGNLDEFSYKIVASHTDSPALKLKDNAVMAANGYDKLNVEKYGGMLLYSYLDRPLKIAGRVVTKENGVLTAKTVTSDYPVSIPSVAIHMNRNANDALTLNPQTDMLPLLSLTKENGETDFLSALSADSALAYDLYVVNADAPYAFGLHNEFVAAPRVDDLASVYASLTALVSHGKSNGVSLAVCLDNEEVGSRSPQGADGDFLGKTLKRIAYALKFDETEYYKALANSFMISLDNAHAVHPNHPEKADPTNKPVLGGGVVIKAHAQKAYVTDAMSSAILKTVFDDADVAYQTFYNRSDMPSGSTLGAIAQSHVDILAVDLGLPQLAMHSACECFAKSDYAELAKGLAAFYSANLTLDENGWKIH